VHVKIFDCYSDDCTATENRVPDSNTAHFGLSIGPGFALGSGGPWVTSGHWYYAWMMYRAEGGSTHVTQTRRVLF
jgi:hypothetical protein